MANRSEKQTSSVFLLKTAGQQSTPGYLNQKTVMKCVQENNLNIDKPKTTVCKELTGSASLFGEENISDTEQDIAKGQNKMQN